MSNEVAVREEELLPILQTSLYPGASIQSIRMVLGYCKAAGLDVMQKPVHIVPMYDRASGGMRDVVMPGIGLYRTQASRSGECAGVSEPEFGDDVHDDFGGAKITYPKWCKVTVKRRLQTGEIVEFTAREFWIENYAVKGGKEKSIAPNAMWAKRPYGQLAKCAEAQALRKAFPEFGSQPVAEEMEGKQYAYEDAPPVQQVDDGYQAFEDLWLPVLREAAMAGTDSLRAGHANLAPSPLKDKLWVTHGKALKEAATKADEQRTVEEA